MGISFLFAVVRIVVYAQVVLLSVQLLTAEFEQILQLVFSYTLHVETFFDHQLPLVNLFQLLAILLFLGADFFLRLFSKESSLVHFGVLLKA